MAVVLQGLSQGHRGLIPGECYYADKDGQPTKKVTINQLGRESSSYARVAQCLSIQKHSYRDNGKYKLAQRSMTELKWLVRQCDWILYPAGLAVSSTEIVVGKC